MTYQSFSQTLGLSMLVGCLLIGGKAHADDTASANVDSESEVVQETDAALSVPPLGHIEYPADRPKWIDGHEAEPAKEEGGKLVFKTAVSSGPSPTRAAAVEMMQVMARAEITNFAEQRGVELGLGMEVESLPIEQAWLDDVVVVRRYDGQIQVGGEPAFESAALLQLSEGDRGKIDRLIRNEQLGERLAATGIVVLLGFGGLLGGSIVLGGIASRQRKPLAS